MSEPTPEPTVPAPPAESTIWLYGFLPMTRRRYIFQLIVAFGLAVGFIVLWQIYWPTFREHLEPMKEEAAGARVLLAGDLVSWVVGGVAVLQLIEAYFVLRWFARKQQDAQ